VNWVHRDFSDYMDKGRTQKIAPLRSKAHAAKNENSIVE
jgi:hypothetical protein